MYDHKSLLDKRREGQEFSLANINRALRNAGDLEPYGSKRVDKALSQETARARQARGTSMVGKCKSGLEKETWPGWSKYLDYQHEATK